jgi:hypothetical protein
VEKILNLKNIEEENKATEVKDMLHDIVDKDEIETLKKIKNESLKTLLNIEPKELQQV